MAETRTASSYLSRISWPMALGFALLLSFMDTLSLVSASIPIKDIDTGAGFLVAVRLLEVATFIFIALTAGKIGSLVARIPLILIFAALCVMQVALQIMTITDIITLDQLGVRIISAFIRSVALSAFWLSWIEFYAKHPMRLVMINYLMANVLAAIFTMALNLVGVSVPMLIILAVMPVISAYLLVYAYKQIDSTSHLHENNETQAQRFPVMAVVLMAVFTLANVFARDVLPTKDRLWATVGVVVCLVMLFFALRLGSMRFGIWPLCGVAFPLTLAGLFGLLLNPDVWGIAATLSTHAGAALFSVFMGVVLCNIAYRYGVSALRLFGFAQAAASLASLTGALLAFRAGLEGDSFTLAVAAMGLALCICYVILTRKQEGEIVWGVDPSLGEDTALLEAAHDQQGDAETPEHLFERCSRIAYEYGLTRREEEVLVLLAQGQTAKQIEDTLVVTNSTVKSHTHAVYQKLGLHSRAELIEFVAGQSR
ncbi:MAG: helix-turn-helix transcriptional regulator [Coriobacteriales bacterium]|nr:helix-turn-helix transcriptional regulator [Coriobacteriales bacterium]